MSTDVVVHRQTVVVEGESIKPQTWDDAKELGKWARAGEYRMGLLVARNVFKGRPQAKANSALADKGKVSTSTFAKVAGVSQDTVARFLAAWDLAATEGHVPASITLSPGDELELDAEALPKWSEWTTAISAPKPKPAVESKPDTEPQEPASTKIADSWRYRDPTEDERQEVDAGQVVDLNDETGNAIVDLPSGNRVKFSVNDLPEDLIINWREKQDEAAAAQPAKEEAKPEPKIADINKLEALAQWIDKLDLESMTKTKRNLLYSALNGVAAAADRKVSEINKMDNIDKHQH